MYNYVTSICCIGIATTCGYQEQQPEDCRCHQQCHRSGHGECPQERGAGETVRNTGRLEVFIGLVVVIYIVCNIEYCRLFFV